MFYRCFLWISISPMAGINGWLRGNLVFVVSWFLNWFITTAFDKPPVVILYIFPCLTLSAWWSRHDWLINFLLLFCLVFAITVFCLFHNLLFFSSCLFNFHRTTTVWLSASTVVIILWLSHSTGGLLAYLSHYNR